jgi:hypothetical protein
VSSQNALHRRKPQAPPGELCRKERIEDLRLGVRIHTGTVILNLEQYVRPRNEVARNKLDAGYCGRIKKQEFGLDDDCASPGFVGRFRGIQHQIHDDLLHLA